MVPISSWSGSSSGLRGRNELCIADFHLGRLFAGAALETGFASSAVHRLHQCAVFLGNGVTSQLAGARECAVVGAQFLAQDGKRWIWHCVSAGSDASCAFTTSMQSAISA